MKIRFSKFLIIALILGLFPVKQGLSQDTIRIMPLGNSITEGIIDGTLTNELLRGYRYGLRYMLKNNGYKTDFVGSQSNGSAYFSDCQHAGIGGTRDQYLVRLLTDGYDERNDIQILIPPRPYLDEYNPDIILLHIGTNDVTHEGADALTNQKVSEILDMIDQYEVRANKEVIVFLALIINRVKPWPAGSKAAITTAFNNGIKTMALNRIISGDKLVIVDMENDAGFEYSCTIDMAPDGVHPNETGYNNMATRWLTSITENYNSRPLISEIPDQNFNEGQSSPVIFLDDYVTDKEDADQDINWTFEQIGPENMVVTINSDRQVVVTPRDHDWNGVQTIVFSATDLGNGGKFIKTSSDTVCFKVAAVNNPPIITSTPESMALVGSLFTYTLSATDIDGDSIIFSAVTIPSWLSFSDAEGELEGIPISASCGQNEVILRASDGLLNSDQDFFISVNDPVAINHANEEEFSIFPVPAQNFLMVDPGKFRGEVLLEVISSSGARIKSMLLQVGQDDFKIDLANFENGIYFLHLFNKSVNYFSKFAVSR